MSPPTFVESWKVLSVLLFLMDNLHLEETWIGIPSFAFLRRSLLDISEKEFDHKLTFRNHLIMYLFNEGI